MGFRALTDDVAFWSWAWKEKKKSGVLEKKLRTSQN